VIQTRELLTGWGSPDSMEVAWWISLVVPDTNICYNCWLKRRENIYTDYFCKGIAYGLRDRFGAGKEF
jgi:hypothetical protein